MRAYPGETIGIRRSERVGDVGEIGQIHAVVLGLSGSDRLLVRLKVAVAGKAAAGGDELADDDIFLQADQMVDLALDGSIGEHLRRLLILQCREVHVLS